MERGIITGMVMGSTLGILLCGGIGFLALGLRSEDFANNRMNWMTVTGMAMLASIPGLALACSGFCYGFCVYRNAEVSSPNGSTQQPQVLLTQSAISYAEGSASLQSRR